MFLYIVPLKQGLTPEKDKKVAIETYLFLYIVPLKQGLKLKYFIRVKSKLIVFIHSSIKTRIETPIQFIKSSIYH